MGEGRTVHYAYPIKLTKSEHTHLQMLMGKDIGWQRKYKTGKEETAKDIYDKLKSANIQAFSDDR